METQFQLGDWVVEPALNRLTRNGQQVRLEPKVMQVLLCLAEAGEVVPKEKLMQRVWADTYVTDDVLTRSISELRKAFNDDSKRPQFIQTIPKSGYRLLLPALPVRAANGADHRKLNAVQPAVAPVPSRKRLNAVSWSLISIVLVTAAGTISWIVTHKSKAAPLTNGKVVLAVLPFQNLSSDPDQDFFADGLTAEMISQLGRLPADRISVIAWNSMMKYKGVRKSDDVIGSELGANYILEGTVRRSSNQVRITAELVRVGDRSHIWANSYDGDLGDVLNLQSRLAREIAGDIRVSVRPEQEQQLAQNKTLNGEGYDAYLRGRFVVSMNAESDGMRSRIAFLQRSIELNPGYAPGYVGLANLYRQLTNAGWAPPLQAYPRMRAALETALVKQPDNEEAHYLMVWLEWRFDWNFQAAEADFRKAVQVTPSNAGAHHDYALFLKSMGRYDEALQEARRGVELNPLDSNANTNLGALLALMGRMGPATEQFRKAEELDPIRPYAHERLGQAYIWQHKYADAVREFDVARQLSHDQPEKLAWLAYAFAKAGERDQALRLLAQLNRLPGEQYLSPFHMSFAYIALGDPDTAIKWLEKAYRDRDEWMIYLKVYPEFDPLRSDPRFKSLVKRVGLE